MSVDPLADHPNQVDKSPYAYAWNNPINLTDPDGRCPDCPEDANAGDTYEWGGSTFTYNDGSWSTELPEVSVSASPLQIGETRDVTAPDPLGVDYANGLFGWGRTATEVYIGEGDWVNLGNYRGKHSVEMAAMLFPIGGPVKGAGALWKVGQYNNLRKFLSGEKYARHHVGQSAGMKKFIPNFNHETAPSILVPYLGHGKRIEGVGVVSRSLKGITSARQLLARDILEIRRVWPDAPNSALRELINLNKKMYPSAFIKKVK